jgi:hypothetical protein
MALVSTGLPLKVEAVLRAITNVPGIREIEVVSSSVNASTI